MAVKLLQKNAESPRPDYSLTNALQAMRSPRLIPALIGVMDIPQNQSPGFNPYENILRQFAQIRGMGMGSDRGHDSLWWRVWWHDNKKQYPAEIQKLPIPRFRKTAAPEFDSPAALAPRPRLEQVFVSQDENRSYWLIGATAPPPVPLSQRDKTAIANSGLKKLAAVKQDRPGLLVVLSDADTADPAILDTWLDVSDALGGRYFIAVAIRPRWNDATSGRWLTQPERSLAPTAAFTTETFAADIARQVESNVALDPDRIFLIAEGKSGSAGLACALQKTTTFRGFCLLSASFRSALLPPLAAAKGRRFFLALGLVGHGGTDALAGAAEPLLKQRAAVVQSERIKSGSLQDGIQQGIRWLEH